MTAIGRGAGLVCVTGMLLLVPTVPASAASPALAATTTVRYTPPPGNQVITDADCTSYLYQVGTGGCGSLVVAVRIAGFDQFGGLHPPGDDACGDFWGDTCSLGAVLLGSFDLRMTLRCTDGHKILVRKSVDLVNDDPEDVDVLNNEIVGRHVEGTDAVDLEVAADFISGADDYASQCGAGDTAAGTNTPAFTITSARVKDLVLQMYKIPTFDGRPVTYPMQRFRVRGSWSGVVAY